MKQTATYGGWRSPISAELLSSANVGLSEPQLDDGRLYWLESRPLERGRSVVVSLENGNKRDLLPAPLNARSQVNEYGGGSYCVAGGQLYFVQFDDQRIYTVDLGAAKPGPRALTPEGDWSFGNLTVDASRQRLLAVCEDHSGEGEAQTSIAAISLDAERAPHILLSGYDFYASPSISPDGKQIAWLCWKHPNMPWDGNECWLGDFDAKGEIVNARRVAGGPRESIAQPQWSPEGELFLVSDRNNWWNIYRVAEGQLQNVCEREAEFASPQWVFGQSTFGFLSPRSLLASYSSEGIWQLCRIDLDSGQCEPVETGLSDISYLRVNAGKAVFVGASGDSFPALYEFDPVQNQLKCLLRSGETPVEAAYIARGEAIQFPLSSPANNQGHAFFYPPINKDYVGAAGSKPPLLVLCHGGPTSATRNSLNFKIQYWTSRGFAVADVNYGGSTGYGRDYRERLNGQWGIVDVQDAVDCVRFLASEGRIDADKVAIRGSSAGGYTVLAALTFHDVFRAGASLYGIGDLETLAADTHKFESRYLDNLVGPYPAAADIYRARSPIHHVEQLDCPVIFLQGMKDKIVPPNQAEAMVKALDERHLPVAYVTFEDEGHGFRQAQNIRRALEAELYFYSRVFGFDLAESVAPVPIRNEERLGERL